jgi:peptide-methionine (S)-S-oxide reductase
MCFKNNLVFGSGCFWCTEAIFKYVSGVLEVIPGYTGGSVKNPTYEQVCSGITGHAEVVKITFDNTKVSLDKLLEIFFKTHDPTTLNRQGNDVGTQYRSAIFYENENELKYFEDYIIKLNQSNTFISKIITTLEKKSHFYEAEQYHHNYFEKNPLNGYCNMVVRPKIEKFRSENIQ